MGGSTGEKTPYSPSKFFLDRLKKDSIYFTIVINIVEIKIFGRINDGSVSLTAILSN